MTVYLLDKRKYSDLDAEFQNALKLAYERKERPGCLCRPQQPPEMYIALYDGNYIIKRMPETGQSHHPSCEHFEAPPGLSGRGELIGKAIKEDTETGRRSFSFAFSLSKTGNRVSPSESGEPSDTVKTDGTKLTLKSFFDALWHDAGFHHWSPAREGKRKWKQIHKFICERASETDAARKDLSEYLFIPEPYSKDRQSEINTRRITFMNSLLPKKKGPRKLGIILAEVNQIEKARFGHKMTIRQSNQVFMVNDDLWKRLEKRFEKELSLSLLNDKGHLMVMGTFSYNEHGIATVEEAALQFVNENWLPVEDQYEMQLIEGLVRSGRRFEKGLRYNLSKSKPVATATLQDTAATTALFIVPPGAAAEYGTAIETLSSENGYEAWIWDVAAGEIPEFPEK